MQALLKHTQKKEKKTFEIEAKQGYKTIPNYAVFPVNYMTDQKGQKIRKFLAGLSIKHGCLCYFVAKWPYLDGLLCQLIYEHVEHTNKHGESYHGGTIFSFYNALGSNTSEDMDFV